MRSVILFLAVATATVFAQDLDRVRDAIVHIETVDRACERAMALREQKFNRAELAKLKIHQPYTMKLSGVVISGQGEILTTALHPRADLRVSVIFCNGKMKEAKIVGNDPLSNLALLKVDLETKHHLPLAGAGAVAQNDIVHLVGSVAGRRRIKTQALHGNVGLARVPVTVRDIYGVYPPGEQIPIATAFAIATTQGRPNLGTACVDAKGNLTGIVIGGMPPRTVRVPPNRLASLEIRFALPAARILRLVKDMRTHGYVVRAYYGVQLAPVSDALRAQFELPRSACRVSHVERGGPAAAAGLRLHDLILSLDGKTFEDGYLMGEALSDRKPQELVTFDILRAGQKHTLQATPVLRKLPDEEK